MKVVCDINVILDIFLERKPFHASAAALFAQIEEGKVRGLLCALSFPTLCYLLCKSMRREQAIKVLEKLRIVFRVAPVDEKVVDLALTADFKDFEDAVHYYSAIHVRADCLITRNKKDFPAGRMTILTPEEFLALHPDS